MYEMGEALSCPDYGYAALGLHLTRGSKGCMRGMRSARIWACSMSLCMMTVRTARTARTVRMAKVAVVAWKVAAEHGGCWVSSCHPGGFLDGHGGCGNVLGCAHVRQMVHACTMHAPWQV